MHCTYSLQDTGGEHLSPTTKKTSQQNLLSEMHAKTSIQEGVLQGQVLGPLDSRADKKKNDNILNVIWHC